MEVEKFKLIPVQRIDWSELDTHSEKANDSNGVFIIPSHSKLYALMEEIISSYLSETYRGEYLKDFIRGFNEIATEQGLALGHDVHQLNDWIVEIQWILEDPLHDEEDYLRAQFHGYLSLISSYMAYMKLKNEIPDIQFCDNRDYIICLEQYEDPEIILSKTSERIEKLNPRECYVMQEKLASTEDNNSTILAEPWYQILKHDGV